MPTPADAAASVSAAAIPAAAPRRRPTAAAEDVYYPSSDGKRMAENTWQGDAIIATAGDLKGALPGALVAADILVYPERGNNSKSRAPDVLVALGVGTHHRSSYFVWQEGKPPDWVLEVASPSTEEKDRCSKRDDYLAMGVQEYWLFDPKGDVYPPGTPRLRGLELKNGKYRPLESRLEDGVRMIRSEVLGLGIRAEEYLLRFWDPATRRDIRHQHESETAAVQEAARRERAEARADREAARAEQEAARAGQEAAQRKRAEARADREAARAGQEAEQRKRAEAARSAAEARVEELEAALRSLRNGQRT